MIPKLGEELKNGRLLIGIRDDPRHPGWFVVMGLGSQSYHPYAVWAMDANGECFRGDYSETLIEATERFVKR